MFKLDFNRKSEIRVYLQLKKLITNIGKGNALLRRKTIETLEVILTLGVKCHLIQNIEIKFVVIFTEF